MKLVELRARRRRWARSRSRTRAAWRLRLQGTYIDATIEHAIERTASLVVERRRTEVRIAGVNRWAPRQQRVRKGWAAVILQGTKQRIRIDLIARASQITGGVIAAEIVSLRGDGDGAAAVEDVCTQCAGIQDCVGDLNDTYTKLPVDINAPARRCRVAGDRAICNAQRRVELADSDTAPARSS
jgi:hypothetical protein